MAAASAPVRPFTCIPDAVLRNAQVPGQARLLYSILLSYRNRTTGQCTPALGTLAADLGCSLSTVQRLIRVLESTGLVHHARGTNPHDPWSYQFAHLHSDQSAVTGRVADQSAVTGQKPVDRSNGVGQTGQPCRPDRSPVTPLYKDEPDDRTRVTEPERAVVTPMARAREASPPQLGKAVGEPAPAESRGTDQLRWVVGLAGREQDDRWAEFEPLLLPPVLRFGLNAADPTLRKDIRTLATQLHTLVKESGVPREELVRWQIWQMGDPWWTTARYKYNPQRAFDQSWQIWKREGQPGAFVPRTPPTRSPAGPAIPTRGPTPGDPTVYGHGHVRWAQAITEEQLAAYSASLASASLQPTTGLDCAPRRLLS